MEERLLNILKVATRYKATDIHFSYRHNEIEIAMRIDNKPIKLKSKEGDEKLIRYLQYRSNLDVGRLNEPQTGQFEMELDNNILSLRFAVINSYNSTNGVLRILNSNVKISVDNLSHKVEQNEYFKSLLKKDNGLIIFSGPTGSGKTTTLYSLLNSLKDTIIYTIEDPIEIYNDKFIQLQINEKLGFDYEAGIKQIMRHDPDIIMIGEIRDSKAAKMALRAANTGHLVLTTIHASNASSVISRMVDLGVDKNYLYEMLLCLVNQRMMIGKNGEKVVVYEIMKKDEIEYFRKNGCNSKSFLSLETQIRKGINEGLLKEAI